MTGPSLQRCGRCELDFAGLDELGFCTACAAALRRDPALDEMTAERDRAWKAHSVMAGAYTRERDGREALEAAVRPLLDRCERMAADDLCDCPPEGHACGKDQLWAEVQAVRRLLTTDIVRDVTDDFVGSFKTADDFHGVVARLVASGSYPLGVNERDPRVVTIQQRCVAALRDDHEDVT